MLENLHDEIVGSRSTKLCTVGAFYAKLDAADRARLDALFEDEEILSTEIARALQPHVKLASNTVSRHRRRAGGNGCGCP